MKNALFKVFLVSCLLIFNLSDAVSEEVKERPPVSDETEICIECHNNYSPGIVKDWLNSRHASVTPADAMKKPKAQSRFSAGTLPENLGSVAVGCYECHGLNTDAHQDNFEHLGISINTVVSPNDCKTCHTVEVEQYMDSKKAHAVGTLRDNPVYTGLVETIIGLKSMQDGKIVRAKASDFTKAETCYACHGTDVKVSGTRTISTDVGEMEFPVLTNWPNQGVGRLNPDGSRGACTSCHPRHRFSIEVARKPYTCSQCHLEPDVPAWNVYKESKHGNIYFSMYDKWQWDEVPWKLGENFSAPTCATCHNSLVVDPDGGTIVPRTHDFGARLWVRAFGLIYSHPQPKKGDTYNIKNKDGLPLPVTFGGEPASEYLISREEQAKRQAAMENLCKSCHGSSWVNGHFAKMDNTFAETDKMVATATQLMSKAWESGLADNSNPFDESIEQKWAKQWLFYANSVRYASAMTGAPDYAAFKNGWWNLTNNLQEMQSLVALKGGDAESPPTVAADTNTNTEKNSAPNDSGFGGVDLSELSEADMQYLGIKGDARPILHNVDADLIIFEFLSVYCTSCQMQSPIFNKLYSEIQEDDDLRSRVRMIALGVGNNQREVEHFKKEREIPFPILTDPKFATYEKLANSMRTPYTVLLKRDKAGNLAVAGSHMGLIRSYESYLIEIEGVLEYDEDELKEKQMVELKKDVTRIAELKLSGEELMAKVEEVTIKASGDKSIKITAKTIPAWKDSKVYEGVSRNVRYFAVVVSRESVCDICHAIQFIYVFNEVGVVIEFEPIHLTKYGNKVWSKEDVEKMRKRVLGKSVLQPMSFDPEVDAVTSATITSAIIFQALSQGRDVFRYVIK